MHDLTAINFTSVDGQADRGENGRISLKTEAAPYGNFADDDKLCTFSSNVKYETEEYFVLEYSSVGIGRLPSSRKPFVFALTEQGDIPLACYDDIIIDSCRHCVAVKTECNQCTGLRIEFKASRGNEAKLEIYKMYTCTERELPVCCDLFMTKTAKKFEPINLSALYNSRYHTEDNIIDGGQFFNKEQISLFEIPFCVKLNGNNLISPPPPPKENDEIIDNFGARAKRRLCRPISRDSLTEIVVKRQASEIFLLINLNGKRHMRWGFSADGTILGTYCGDVNMPLLANEPEQFAVEIIYESGKTDWCIPLNLATKRHGISGDTGVYAIPADGDFIEKIVLHNRMLDSNCLLAAVTVNTTNERLLPDMLIPKPAKKITRKADDKKETLLYGTQLTLRSGALHMVIDISEGLNLLYVENAFTPALKIKKDGLLKIRKNDGSFITHFDLIRYHVCEKRAEMIYRCEPLEITVIADLSNEHGILWNINVKNPNEKAYKCGIFFPCIAGLEFENFDDTFCFFPKYQNIDGNESFYLYEESSPSFPMQFFDVYSRSQNGGLSLVTHELNMTVRKYMLQKNKDGVSFFVEYPNMYGEIPPNGERVCSPALLAAHQGGWQKSFEIYKDWVDSWYKPYHCQDKQWYRECFWLIAEITDFFETEEITNLPIWYNKKKQEFNFLKILEEQKKITGCYPDILHLWSWAYRVKNGIYSQQWGNFGSTDYDEYGGAENFRHALQEVTDKTGTAVSLYLHPTLLSERYPQSKKYFGKYRVINEKGSYISIEEDSYRMCHANKEWRKYAVDMYTRVCHELSVPILYVDEFGLRVENRCYSANHGHSVPSNLLQTDREFISELKKAVPEDIVLYGEYAAADVNARYIDCNITYYIVDSVSDMVENSWRGNDGEDRMSRVYTNVYRFAFPKIVQLVLPMAMRNMSWHPQKFIFFNGEAIYDSFWDCEESAGLEFTIKAYHIKKKYADCFSSDSPKTMIETQSPAICANRFTGNGRVVYTLYNRAYSTYRGEVLRIPHMDGAQYYDAWNDKLLTPKICGGYAEISLEIHAMQIGCIAVMYDM